MNSRTGLGTQCLTEGTARSAAPGRLTEEVARGKVQRVTRNSPLAWTPVRRAGPFQAERLSQGLTQPHDIPCLYGKLQAGGRAGCPGGEGSGTKPG